MPWYRPLHRSKGQGCYSVVSKLMLQHGPEWAMKDAVIGSQWMTGKFKIFLSSENIGHRKKKLVRAPTISDAWSTSLLTRRDCWYRSGYASTNWAANRRKIEDDGPPLQLLMELFHRWKEENWADQAAKRKTKGKVSKFSLSLGIIDHRRWLVEHIADT